MRRVVPAAAVAIAALSAVGVALALGGPVTISGPSPFASCAAPAAGGTSFLDSEVEPFVAVDPVKAGRAIAVWQQDRWSNGGAHALMSATSSDGGATWSAPQGLPFNECVSDGLSYQRASDPWVSIGPDGKGGSVAYSVSISFDQTDNDNAVAAVSSTDDGQHWGNLTVLRQDDNQNQFFNDKESVTADPYRPNTAYAVWDQLVSPTDNPSVIAHNGSSFTGPTYFSKTADGGKTWSGSQVIVPMRQNQQSIANQIIVSPDSHHTVYDFFTLITGTGPNNGPQSAAPHGFAIAYVTSTDGGQTWSQTPQIAQPMDSVTATDPNTGQPLRTADFDADVAIDPSSGKIYLVWQDARNTHVNGKNHENVFPQVLESTGTPNATDGTVAWSDPKVVSLDHPTDPSTEAILPTVAVQPDGTVGIDYYDFGELAPDNTTMLPTDVWFTSDFGATREKVTGPFNFLAAPGAGGRFLGDYDGLAASGSGWLAVYDKTNCSDTSCVGGSNPDDTYASTLP